MFQIDLAAAWVTGQLCRFCVQIQNLLKNKYRCKLDHPKWSWSYFPSFTDLAISGATMGISNFPVQILNLLKNKSRYKLDCPKQSSSYLLILCSYHCSSYIRCYNGN